MDAVPLVGAPVRAGSACKVRGHEGDDDDDGYGLSPSSGLLLRLAAEKFGELGELVCGQAH